MYLIRIYNQSTRYLYSSTFQSTCTQVFLKIQYLYLYWLFFQVLVHEYFCPVLSPKLVCLGKLILFFDYPLCHNGHPPQTRATGPFSGSMLAHCLRRWPNIGQGVSGCLVFAGLDVSPVSGSYSACATRRWAIIGPTLDWSSVYLNDANCILVYTSI